MKYRYLAALGLLVGGLTFTVGLGGGAVVGYRAAPREIITVDSRVQVAEAIRRLRLEPISLPIHDHLNYNNFRSFDDDWVPGASKWLYGKGVQIEGSGFVTAVFDLQNVTARDVRTTADGFEVTLGSPRIGWTILPAESVRDSAEPYKGASVSQAEISEWQRRARMQMEVNLRTAACRANILEQASTEVKNTLPAFVAVTSGNVKVIFVTTAGVCPT